MWNWTHLLATVRTTFLQRVIGEPAKQLKITKRENVLTPYIFPYFQKYIKIALTILKKKRLRCSHNMKKGLVFHLTISTLY